MINVTVFPKGKDCSEFSTKCIEDAVMLTKILLTSNSDMAVFIDTDASRSVVKNKNITRETIDDFDDFKGGI